MLLLRIIRPPSTRITSAAYSTLPRRGQPRQSPRNTVARTPQPSHIPNHPEKASVSPERHSDNVRAVSEALQQTENKDNSLLAPVHIPEDPNGVLRENHPAAGILANSAIIIQRQLELMNVMLGFEQANRYVIMGPQGNHIGYMAERELGLASMMARQWFRTHRSFTTHVFDRHEREVLRFHRPFSWISSRIRVYDAVEPAFSSYSSSTALRGTQPGILNKEVNGSSSQISPLALSDMRVIGEAQQQWAPLRRKYNLFVFRHPPSPQTDLGSRPSSSSDATLSDSQQLQARERGEGGEYAQFAYVDEPFLSWDFSLLSADSKLIGSVNRNFAGFAREIFTDTGVYALRMDAAGIAEEPDHLISKTGKAHPLAYGVTQPGMTLDQRAVMLATAVSIDFDYFSRHSTSGGLGFMPMWFPGGGEAAAGGAAAGGGAVSGGAADAGGAVGGAARGAAGAGGIEGAATGGAALGVYEGLQRGVYGGGSPPAPGDPPTSGSDPAQSEGGASAEGEEVRGDSNPWGGGQDGDQEIGDGEGVGGGDGSWSDWF